MAIWSNHALSIITMHKFVPFIILCLFIAFSAPAFAKEEPKKLYVSGALGFVIGNPADWQDNRNNLRGDIEIQKTGSFAGALGIRLNQHFAFDAEISYRNADLDEISVTGAGDGNLNGYNKLWAGLLNGYFILMPKNDWSPYFSVGFGIARHEAEIDPVPALGVTGGSSNDTVGAYQLGLGINYNMSKQTQLWTGYRYFGTDRPVIDGNEFEYTSHDIMVGLKRHFSF